MPHSLLGGISRAILQAFFDKAVAALAAGTLDECDDTTLICAAITVDRVGRTQAIEVLNTAFTQLRSVHDQSCQRLAMLEEDSTQMIISLAGFEAASPDRIQD